jgi:hypothetical protein
MTHEPDLARAEPPVRGYPDHASPEVTPLQARPGVATSGSPDTIQSLETFLAALDEKVSHSGKVFLFTGDRLRLDITLLRHDKNPRVIWGLRRHEEWAFKATLLRFARGHEPLHVLLFLEQGEQEEILGWVVGRSLETFWASPISSLQTSYFWERCLARPWVE